MIRALLLAAAMLLPAGALSAQASPYTPYAPLPLGDTLLNLPTPRTLAKDAWEVRFTHRFSQPIGDGDVHSLWGLDSSADVGIGLSWSPVRDLQISAFRIDVQDDIELAAKYSVLQQAPAVPLSIAARGGIDVRTEQGMEDRTSFFAQVILSRQFGRRAEVFAVPTYASEAAPFDHAFNVPVGAAFALRPYLSLVVEFVPPNGDLPDDMDSDFGWSIGLKRALGGHYFEVMFTDTRATNVDQYVSGGFLGGIDASDVHLGFNISRRFGGRRR